MNYLYIKEIGRCRIHTVTTVKVWPDKRILHMTPIPNDHRSNVPPPHPSPRSMLSDDIFESTEEDSGGFLPKNPLLILPTERF